MKAKTRGYIMLAVVVCLVVWGALIEYCNIEALRFETPTDITFEEIVNANNSRPTVPRNATSLQRAMICDAHNLARDKKYMGKLVEWTGTVNVVKEDSRNIIVKFRHVKDHIDDVSVEFSLNYRRILLKLQRGDTITYRGKISGISNGGWFNIRLRDGRI